MTKAEKFALKRRLRDCYSTDKSRVYEIAEREIDRIPTTEERPKGEWILQEVAICHGKVVPYEEVANYGYDSSLLCTCSVCGRNFYIDDDTELLIKYPYCHCGADMRGAE